MNDAPIIVLVDGSNLAHKLFHALGEMPTASKLAIVLRQVHALANMSPRPKHVAICFDSDGPNWRRELYPEYKATRGPKPEGLAELLGLVVDHLHRAGFDTWERPGVEADDLIATRWQHAQQTGHRCVIVSADRDLFQLLRDGTSSQLIGFRTNRGTVTNAKWWRYCDFCADYAMVPPQWPTYRAIAGDKSDNIPGIAGLGPKAACVICRDYLTLEDAVADRWKLALNRSQRVALENAVRDGTAARFIKICTLVRNVGIDDPLESQNLTGMETNVNASNPG